MADTNPDPQYGDAPVQQLSDRRIKLARAEIEAIFATVHGLHPCANDDCQDVRLRMHRVLTDQLPLTRFERFVRWITG